MGGKKEYIFKDHAVLRMLERGIEKSEVKEAVELGEIIEEYPDDKPFPSCLMFRIINQRPLHVVVANNHRQAQMIIVTVYIPDSANFESDFKTRKTR